MRSSLARGRLRPAFIVALLLLAATAAALPGGSVAEEASEPGSPGAVAAQLDAGRNHSCAVLTTGGVRCWGFGGEGELGYGTPATVGDDETPGAAGAVDLGAGRRAASISAGNFHTCAELDDGSVRCWGFGRTAQLGNRRVDNIGDDESPGTVPPVKLGAGRTATAISAGGYHTCAILNDGNVRCWGYGFYGALGNPGDPNHAEPGPHPEDIGDDEDPADEPVVNLGGQAAVAISAGGYHVCAILVDRTVRCWGYGQSGQLGYGTRVNVNNPSGPDAGPVNLGAGRTALAISAGELHTCALLDDRSVRCWGVGLNGRLGYGNEDSIGDTELPGSVPPVDLGQGRSARSISAGDSHTCARLDDGSARCWGAGTDGRLGYRNTTPIGDTETPGTVGPVDLAGRTASAISAGGRHTCARLVGDVDGSGETDVSCWGYGGNGRLGYCNQRNVGDDEAPGDVGPVPIDIDVRAPSTAYPGCARPAPDVPVTPPPPAGDPNPPNPISPFEAEAQRRRAFRSCLAEATAHATREIRRARRSSRRTRARLKRHIKRHRAQKRRACLRRHGRTPGRVTGLSARATRRGSVVLTFGAAGTDGSRPPAARTYVVKQSRRPIRSSRAFRKAQTLCKGRCRFPDVRVGATLTLTVKDLRRRTRYYYAVAARDNVTRKLGRRSRATRVKTR